MTRDVWPRTSGTDLPTRVIPGFAQPRSSGTKSVTTRGSWLLVVLLPGDLDALAAEGGVDLPRSVVTAVGLVGDLDVLDPRTRGC